MKSFLPWVKKCYSTVNDNKGLRIFWQICLVVFAVVGFIDVITPAAKPGLTYHEYPLRTSLRSSKDQLSRITVFYDSVRIAQDATYAQIQIWNAGKKPIRSDDLLEITSIRFQGNPRIIESKLLRTTRDVCQIQLDTLSQREGVLKIKWRILEHRDAAIIQVLYEGNPKCKILVKSVIEGQRKIRMVNSPKYTFSYKDTMAQWFNYQLLTFVIYLLALMQFLFFLFVSTRDNGFRSVWSYVMLAVTLIYVYLSINSLIQVLRGVNSMSFPLEF